MQAKVAQPQKLNSLRSNRTLLLNASYEPLKIISWQKAIILWLQNKVEVVEYHNFFVRSVRSSFQLPSVLRLTTYVRPRASVVVRFCRENVYIRDNYTCQYCGNQFPQGALTLDHVVPASKQGPKNWTNVVTACRSCNQKKANHTPSSANMPLLSEPVRPAWLPTYDFQVEETQMPPTWIPYLDYKVG
jgi:5-methylcytosine-specific restriction endonuclease McrA